MGTQLLEIQVGDPGSPGKKKQRIPDLQPWFCSCVFFGKHKSLLTKNSRNFANIQKGYFAVNPTSRQTGHSSSLLAELIMSGNSVSLLLVRYPATTTRKQYRRQLHKDSVTQKMPAKAYPRKQCRKGDGRSRLTTAANLFG